jgi:glycosyltransferase involved in cell wall biosynthesis
MMLSVVTAVRNRLGCVAKAVESVNAQTWHPVQHVVVDGASTDGTTELLQSILPRDACLICEPDAGIYDGINKGIARSDGEVVGLLHSDDTFADPDVLRDVARAFEAQPDLDMVYGDIAFIDPEHPGRFIRYYSSRHFRPELLRQGWIPAHTSVFLRRRVFDRHGLYRTDYKIAGDFEFMARIFQDPGLNWQYLPRTMVHMRPGGASTAGLGATWRLNREVLRACRENGLQTHLGVLLMRYPRKVTEFLRPKLGAGRG